MKIKYMIEVELDIPAEGDYIVDPEIVLSTFTGTTLDLPVFLVGLPDKRLWREVTMNFHSIKEI